MICSRALRRTFLAMLVLVLGTVSSSHAADPPVLLVFGDSVSAGYGLPPGKGWVALLAERLKAEGHSYTVVNGSVSGDTTAGGRGARHCRLIPARRWRVGVP